MPEEGCRDKILSQSYRDFIIPDYRSGADVVFPRSQVCVQDLGFGYRAVYIDETFAPEVTIEQYGYNNIPGCYALTDTDAINKAGISAVQNYPTLQLSGSGVMIGFVDTGIDYQNRIFRDINGGSRIAGIWDQTIQDGTLPDGFAYGSEYTREMINQALRLENPLEIVPSMDMNGHGTFLASIAAGGRDVENQFQGAAPKALIGMVKLKEAKDYLKEFYAIKGDAVCFQENDIMQGIYYLHRLAEKQNLPLVICLALGSNFGGHNGTTMLSRILDRYANTLNRCVVTSVGNEASQRHHYYGVLTSDTDTEEAEIRVESGNQGFVMELWTKLPNIMTTYLVSPSGGRSPVISIRQGSRFDYTFAFDRTRVEIEYRFLLENNDSQLIFYRFMEPAEGIWRVGVEPLRISDGEFHIWSSMTEFIDGDVYFLEANPDITLTDTGTTRDAITVSYYNAVENSVDINAGRGYTRSRLIKPEIAAPGVQVTGAGTDGRFVKRSGSSIAAGITAGAAALIMEWLIQQPSITGITTSQVKNILILGAEEGILPEYPNRQWGYGRMDLYQSLDRLRSL